MALSDTRILEHIGRKNIVISPFREDNLGTSSYDVTLGEWYFREQSPPEESDIAQHAFYNIYNKNHTETVWGKKPYQARKACDVLATTIQEGISPNDRIIVLKPGETILAHTEEFIGGKNMVTTMMKARSSLGRNFIEVCKCAGWGDVGYVNRWTMEVTNNSRHYSIPLVVGRRIAQIVFFETGEIRNSKSDYAKKGKYQSTTDLSVLKKNWQPKMMLPKLYKDRDIL
jgi:dCTP deaminase